MQMKLPSFQFYPGDWRKDPGVQSSSYHDRGVWLEILCFMHESSERGKLLINGVPIPDEALARLLGLDKQNLTNTIDRLLTIGVASRCPMTGALMSRRMVRDEELRQIRKKAGSLGGNPLLLKQKPTNGLNQKPTPSSSSSSSSSDREGERARDECHEVPTLEQAKGSVMTIGIPPAFVELVYADWSENMGRNAAGRDVPWMAYIRKRWRYEQVDWVSGKHNGRAGKAGGVALSVADVLDRELTNDLKALEREFDSRYEPIK